MRSKMLFIALIIGLPIHAGKENESAIRMELHQEITVTMAPNLIADQKVTEKSSLNGTEKSQYFAVYSDLCDLLVSYQELDAWFSRNSLYIDPVFQDHRLQYVSVIAMAENIEGTLAKLSISLEAAYREKFSTLFRLIEQNKCLWSRIISSLKACKSGEKGKDDLPIWIFLMEDIREKNGDADMFSEIRDFICTRKVLLSPDEKLAIQGIVWRKFDKTITEYNHIWHLENADKKAQAMFNQNEYAALQLYRATSF